MPDKTTRYLYYVLLAVLGVVVAAAGALVQGGWFPLGLLLALVGTAALFYGGTKLTGTRAGAGVPSGAWLLSVIGLTVSRPEGDFVFPANFGPYLYLMVGALAGVICATLPHPPDGRRTDARLGE